MSHNFVFTAVLLGSLLINASSVLAQTNGNSCPCQPTATRVSGDGNNSISAKLTGNTICAIPSNVVWQEYHNGNRIVELGNSTNGDDIGQWSVIGSGNSAIIRYDYGTGGSYDYVMCEEANGSLIHFCGVTTILNATIKPGKQKCI